MYGMWALHRPLLHSDNSSSPNQSSAAMISSLSMAEWLAFSGHGVRCQPVRDARGNCRPAPLTRSSRATRRVRLILPVLTTASRSRIQP
jgi:hypothetical protein